MISIHLPSWLSCFPEKLELYADDPYFLSGWRTIETLDKQGKLPVDTLWALGSILFKADSVLTGRLNKGLHLLEQNGVRLNAARVVALTPASVRDFWRYSLGRLSEERVSLLGRLMEQSPCLYVLATTTDPDQTLPAALKITDLKGGVAPEDRKPHHLRRAMGRPQTAVLNFVHTADEPADVVRELGLLFGESDRQAFLSEVAAGDGRESVYDMSRRLLAGSPRCGLEIADVLARLRRALATVASDGRLQHEARAVDDLLDRLESGSRGLWPDVMRLLGGLGIEVSELDQIVIEGWTVPLQRQVRTQPFPSCERRHWEARQETK